MVCTNSHWGIPAHTHAALCLWEVGAGLEKPLLQNAHHFCKTHAGILDQLPVSRAAGSLLVIAKLPVCARQAFLPHRMEAYFAFCKHGFLQILPWADLGTRNPLLFMVVAVRRMTLLSSTYILKARALWGIWLFLSLQILPSRITEGPSAQ